MAENAAVDQDAVAEGGKPEEPVDWKAKYNAMREHSRGWEKKAKENAAAAEELERLKASQLSEGEKQEREIAALKAENERYRLTEQKRGWVEQVASETGVPAEVLSLFECSDAEDLKSKAEAVAGKFKTETVPAVAGDGIHARPEPSGGAKADFAACMEKLNR